MNDFFFDDTDALAYETSRWQRLLYGVRADEGPNALTEGEDAVADALIDDFMDHEGSELEEDAQIDAASTMLARDARTFGTEIFSRIYNGPTPVEEPTPWAGLAHGALDEIPEFSALHGAVDKDPDMAALATSVMLRELAPLLPDLLESLRKEQDEQPEPQEQDEQGEPQEAAEGEPEDGEGEEAGPGQSEEAQAAQGAIRAAMARAIREAQGEVAEARQALGGLLPGLDAAPPMHEQAKPERMKLAEKLRADDRLLRILRMAGKIERIADKTRIVRCENTYEEVVGIERGGDIARILPSELVGLAGEEGNEIDELLELQTLAKIAEHAALQYEIVGHERLGRGRIVMLLDESGSMDADAADGMAAMDWAKAVALASLHTAMREHRSMALAGFDTSVRGTLRCDASGSFEHGWGADCNGETHDWQPLDDAQAAAWNILTRAPAGGTSFDRGLTWALANGALDERADILIVTDGRANVSPGILAQLQEAKEQKEVRVFGLSINSGSMSAAMATVCDETVALDRVDDVSTAIGQMGVH